MQLRSPAILVASRLHGETAVIARVLTAEYGLVAGYVAGGRGRQLRPVLIPGNRVEIELTARSASQLPFMRVELVESRAPWMTEPLPAAAITWATALTASSLPERNPYPALYEALDGLLAAICHAPSARGWLGAMVSFEVLVLRELGYGDVAREAGDRRGEPSAQFEIFRVLHKPIARHLLAERRGDVMAARTALGEKLARMLA